MPILTDMAGLNTKARSAEFLRLLSDLAVVSTNNYAVVAESEDAPDLESGGGPCLRTKPRAGSNPVYRIHFTLVAWLLQG